MLTRRPGQRRGDEIRNRFHRFGSDSLSDVDHLEAILVSLGCGVAANAIAEEMITKFGSFAEVLGAPEQRLREIKGIGRIRATELKLVAAAAARIARSKIARRPLLGRWKTVIAYCQAAMAFEPREQFRILFLDKKCVLIADELQQSGTVDHTPVYPREVVRRTLELSASAIILVHNHPSGDPTPSVSDVHMTRRIMETARPLGIIVQDHIIVARDGYASLRGLQLM